MLVIFMRKKLKGCENLRKNEKIMGVLNMNLSANKQ